METVVREIPGPAGALETLIEEPAAGRSVDRDGLVHAGHPAGLRAAVVFAHPHPLHGGTMHSKVVYQTAKAFSRIGCAVLRFNFRGVGRSAGAWDEGRGEMDDFSAALDFMASRYPGAALWAGGFSFGAWVALDVGARDARVAVLVGIAPPLSTHDFAGVERSSKPKFLIQGERDEIFPLRDMREFYARAAEPKELTVIDGADHLFDGKVTDVADAIEELLGDFGK